MDRAELIRELEKSKTWEDEFILKYDSEATWELLKTLGEKKFSRIEKLMKENIEDTRRHKKLLEDVVKKLNSGEHDA